MTSSASSKPSRSDPRGDSCKTLGSAEGLFVSRSRCSRGAVRVASVHPRSRGPDMRFLLLPTAMLLLVATAPAQQKIELQEYTSKDGKYKIRIPGKATEMTKELDIGGKKVPMYTASLQLEG